MKTTGLLFFTIPFMACGSKEKTQNDRVPNVVVNSAIAFKPGKFKTYRLYNYYTVIDTGKYANEGPMGGGSYAIIERNGKVDTINLTFGLKKLTPDIYFYQTLNNENEGNEQPSKGNLSLVEGNYQFIENGNKLLFKNLTQNFDDYFSSPAGINGKIYFWQLEKKDSTGAIKVYAAKYDPVAKKTIAHYLKNDVLETDDSGYFPAPFMNKDTLIFTMDGKERWKFSSDLIRF